MPGQTPNCPEHQIRATLLKGTNPALRRVSFWSTDSLRNLLRADSHSAGVDLASKLLWLEGSRLTHTQRLQNVRPGSAIEDWLPSLGATVLQAELQ